MKLSAEIDAQVAKGLSRAKLNVQLMYMFIRHLWITTKYDIFTGLCDIGFHCCIRIRLVSKLRIGIPSDQSLPAVHLPPSVGSVHPLFFFALATPQSR